MHPNAEPEIIEAAYHRLMRKYHPDMLPPELRSDADILSRVRAINLAYDILSDPIQRSAYDLALGSHEVEPTQSINPEIETRILLVRCARTKQRFRSLIGRRRGKDTIFMVLGFEPMDLDLKGSTPDKEMPRLPASSLSPNPLKRYLDRVQSNKNEPIEPNEEVRKFPKSADINAIFEDNSDLNFSEINFSGHNCPACNGVHIFQNGVGVNWCRCNACTRIYCAGAIHSTKLGNFSRCPWCGTPARITTIINAGDSVNMPVKGEIGQSRKGRPQQQKLKNSKHKELPDK